MKTGRPAHFKKEYVVKKLLQKKWKKFPDQVRVTKFSVNYITNKD